MEQPSKFYAMHRPEPLILQADRMHPLVKLDPNGSICITGNFISNDPSLFFAPIQDWFQMYCNQPADHTVLRFEFNLLGQDSVKYLFQMIKPFSDLHREGHYIALYWFTQKDDADMKEVASIFGSILQIPIYICDID